MTQATRKIPVQYAKRIVGRRMYGGANTHIPLRVNTAGVIPIIFASVDHDPPGDAGGLLPAEQSAGRRIGQLVQPARAGLQRALRR